MLVVDASDHAVATGQTDRSLLARLLKRQVRVYSRPLLHAKVMVLDDQAIIGSANLSHMTERYAEAAVVTDDKVVVAGARSLVLALAAEGDRINESFIQHLQRLKVRKPLLPPRQGKTTAKRRVWLVAVHELDDDAYADELRSVSIGEERASRHAEPHEDVYWVRSGAGNRSRFVREAKRGDRIIEVWHPKSGITKVYADLHVVWVQRSKNWSRFYYSGGPEVLDTAKGWREFQTLWRRSGGGALGKWPCKVVNPDIARRLLAYWDSAAR